MSVGVVPLALLGSRQRSRKVASYGVTVLALIGLLSALSPPLRGRLQDLLAVVPFVIPRTAAVTLVFVSLALLLTARGLRRGQQLAWVCTMALLGVSVVLHLVKGIDVEEALLSLGGLVWLARHRDAFPVRPGRSAVVRALVVAGGGTALAMAFAGLAARRDRQDIDAAMAGAALRLVGGTWSPLAFGNAVITPVLVGFGGLIVVAALWVLLSPRRCLTVAADLHRAERERARQVVERYGAGTLDWFALRDDKQWFFARNSVVAYAVKAGVCVVSPDPVGPPGERAAVWAEFRAFVEAQGWSLSVLGASADWLPTYQASGLRAVYLGDEGLLDCRSFSLEGRAMRGLRQAHHRVTRAGYTVCFEDPALLPPELCAQLRALAGQSRRGEVERGFSMTLSRLFDPADTGFLMSIARDAEGTPQAFIQWVPAPGIDGWSLDVMRRSTDTSLPNGVIDFLIVETIDYLARRGQRGLGLNFAVLRSVVAGEHNGLLGRTGRAVLRRAGANSQLESLWRFSAKFAPEWVPRYVLTSGVDSIAAQGLVIADVEGITELPLLGRFMNGLRT
ncbi:MAG TPA: phosphatidylglycerol lysyltransferase domain-containing protein [Marmoricola sp.]|nr:phosphatidylglycerol lysyltransferase domain-containing protein [Marmoricola sp.]